MNRNPKYISANRTPRERGGNGTHSRVADPPGTWPAQVNIGQALHVIYPGECYTPKPTRTGQFRRIHIDENRHLSSMWIIFKVCSDRRVGGKANG